MRNEVTATAAQRVLADLFDGLPIPPQGHSGHSYFKAGADGAIAAVLQAFRAEQTDPDGLLVHLGPREMQAIGLIIHHADQHLSMLLGKGAVNDADARDTAA